MGLTCLMAWYLDDLVWYPGTWTDWIDGPRLTVWASIQPSVGSCILVTTTPGNPTVLGKSGWKAACQKGTLVYWWIVGWIWARSVPRWPRRPLASWVVSGMVWWAGLGKSSCHYTRHRVLHSVLGTSVQEGHGDTGAGPEKGNEASKGPGKSALWGEVEGAGAVKSGEEEAERRPYCSLPVPERCLQWVWGRSLHTGARWQDEEKWPHVVTRQV